MAWDEMASPWLAAAPDLEIGFSQIFEALFTRAKLSFGETVLDVGCGTGATVITASGLVGETDHVTGVDIALPLLEHAATRVSGNVDFIAADAATFAFQPSYYDVLISNFGIMFFGDNAQAFRNLRRAMRPGGRLIATVWGLPQDNPWFSIPRALVDEFAENAPKPEPDGPGPMRFGDPTGLQKTLLHTGWSVQISHLDLHLSPPGPLERLVDTLIALNVRSMLATEDIVEQDLVNIRNGLVEKFSRFEHSGVLHVPARLHLVSAIAV